MPLADDVSRVVSAHGCWPPPHAQSSVFHHLPVELVRRVFELAAAERGTACALCLVCSDVNEWMTPMLYDTVIFDDCAVEAYNAFYEVYPVRRAAAKMRHVLVRTSHCTLNLKDCTGLRALNVHSSQFIAKPSHYPPASPTLRYLTLRGYPRTNRLDLPFLKSVTHLSLYDIMPSPQLLPAWATNLPNLTHLMCNHEGQGLTSLQSSIPAFLAALRSFPHLRVVAVYVLRALARTPDVRTAVSPIVADAAVGHLQLVINRGERITCSQWEDWSKGRGPSIWDRIDRDLNTARGYTCARSCRTGAQGCACCA